MASDLFTKPAGRFYCPACKKEWDGSQLYLDPQSIGVRWTCGDLACGGNVRRLSDAKKGVADALPAK